MKHLEKSEHSLNLVDDKMKYLSISSLFIVKKKMKN